MREKIINAAIESLRTEGLKFSVDTIASRLKISKKTIYKLFPSKEALAYEIYEEYYRRALENVRKIENEGNNIEIRLLMLYQDAAHMIRSEIFNKYKLNDGVHSVVIRLQNDLWSKIISIIAPSSSQAEERVLRSIIEGAFEKAADYDAPTDIIAEKLVNLL
ncbi:MAG: TetR/AcrR family transcriptional regulator [Eubacterium sp.]